MLFLIKLEWNEEVVCGSFFKLRYLRFGMVFFCLLENDDEEVIKFNIDYWNVEFLIIIGINIFVC